MAQKVIDNISVYTTPQSMIQAIDDNFDELYNNVVDFNPASYGAVGDGTTDDTTAVTNCMTAAESAGGRVVLDKIYKLTDTVNIPPGISVIGASRDTSGFVVDEDDFNLSADGVLKLQVSTKYGPRIEDIQISVDRDTTETVRANLTSVPPAIYAVACPRFFLKNIRINRASVGIDATGNSGGAHITDCEIGAYDYGLKIDGALDFMYIDNIEFWPFGLSGTDSVNIYKDGSTIGLDCRDCDGIAIGKLTTFWNQTNIHGGFGTADSILCDGKYSRVLISGGTNLNIGALYSTSDANDDYVAWVTGTDTNVCIGSLWMTNNVNIDTTYPGQLIIDSATCELVISNIHATIVGVNTRLLFASAGTVCMSNIYLTADINSTLQSSMIYSSGALLNITNLKAVDMGTGSGTLIECTTDIEHQFSNIIATGWTIDLAANHLKPQLSNILSATATDGNRVIGNRKLYEFNITLDSSGNGSVSTNFPVHDQVRAMTVVADTGSYWFCPPPQFLTIGSGIIVYNTNDTNYAEYVLTIRVEMELT
jgi:hypothetical protein